MRAPWTWGACPEGSACQPAECASPWEGAHCRRTAGRFAREHQSGNTAPPRRRPPTSSASISSRKPLSDGEAPPDAERFRGDLQPGGRLLPLVFVAVHFINDVLDQPAIETQAIGDLLRRPVLLDIGFEDGIENVIGWQGGGVLLVRPQ